MPILKLSRNLMGTRFELVLCDDTEEWRLRSAAEEALDEVARLERQLSVYQSDSELSGVNSRAGVEWVQVERRLFRLLQEALRLSRATGGAFDPTLFPLLRAWGFVGARGHLAEPEEIALAQELVGPDRVLLDEARCAVRFDRPGVALDLGAIGKGYAIERARELLQDLGIRNGLLHAGTSTIACLGSPPDVDAWSIAIADPDDRLRSIAEVNLTDGQSLSVSAVHGKCFTGPDGKVYGHVLDGRLGRPVEGAQLSAVAALSATHTDALSTALLVEGRKPISNYGTDGSDSRRPQGETAAGVWQGTSALVLDADGAASTSGGAFHLNPATPRYTDHTPS